MKKKNILIGYTILFIAILLIGLGTLFVFKIDKPSQNKKPNEQENNIPDDSNNNQEEKEKKLYDALSEMYTSNAYIELPKDETGNFYYLTLAEYKKRGYDLTLVNAECPDYSEVATFGIEISDYDKPYPFIVEPVTCRWDESHIK